MEKIGDTLLLHETRKDEHHNPEQASDSGYKRGVYEARRPEVLSPRTCSFNPALITFTTTAEDPARRTLMTTKHLILKCACNWPQILSILGSPNDYAWLCTSQDKIPFNSRLSYMVLFRCIIGAENEVSQEGTPDRITEDLQMVLTLQMTLVKKRTSMGLIEPTQTRQHTNSKQEDSAHKRLPELVLMPVWYGIALSVHHAQPIPQPFQPDVK